MARLGYKDESALALRLRLYAGAVDRSQMIVLAHSRASAGAVGVDGAVIGASHLLEIRTPDWTLTEVLACRGAAAGRPLAMWRPGDAGVDLELREGDRYRFEARLAAWREALPEVARLRQRIDAAARSAAQIGLRYRFPSAAGGASTPETLVWVTAHPRGVTAATAHSYPSEGLVALSLTEMTLESAVADLRKAALLVGV